MKDLSGVDAQVLLEKVAREIARRNERNLPTFSSGAPANVSSVGCPSGT